MNKRILSGATLAVLATATVFLFQNCSEPLPESSDQSSSAASGLPGTKILPFAEKGNCSPMPLGIPNVSTASFPAAATTPLNVDFVSSTSGQIVMGSAGVDIIYGSNYADAIQGGIGNDTLGGRAGNDFIHGNQGDDIITGGQGDDVLYGGQGNDLIYGDAGNDTIYGDLGENIMHGANPTLAGSSTDGNDIFVITLSPVGAATISTNVIYDKGGANQLTCLLSPGDTMPAATARYIGSDLYIDWSGRGNVRIKDYAKYPFACFSGCGNIVFQ